MNDRSRPSHLLVYLFALQQALGIGLVQPVVPQLLQDVSASDTSQISYWYGLLIGLYTAAIFLFSPLLGRISDAWGRRPVMLLALAGSALDYAVAALAPNIWIIVVSRVLAGICGATLIVCNAYLIDTTAPDDRAARFGMMKGALSAGFVLGPVVGGLLGAVHVRAPFWGAAALSAVCVIAALFFLPESHPLERRQPFRLQGAHPFVSLRRVRLLKLPLSALVALIAFEFGTMLVQPVAILFTQTRFGWTSAQFGTYLAVGGVLGVISQAGLTRVAVQRLGEFRAIVLGLVLLALSTFAYGLTDAGWQFYALLISFQLGLIAVPALQAFASRLVAEAHQGELQGILTSAATACAVVAPILGTSLYGLVSRPQSPLGPLGAPYFLGGLILAGALVAALRARQQSQATRAAAQESASVTG